MHYLQVTIHDRRYVPINQAILQDDVLFRNSSMVEITNTIYVTYTIQLTDVNDNTPVCTLTLFTGFLTESFEGVKILTVSATDEDGDGIQGIKFGLDGSNDSLPFEINAFNGELFNTETLDLETQEFYSFIVLAVDQGLYPKRTASCYVSIILFLFGISLVNSFPKLLPISGFLSILYIYLFFRLELLLLTQTTTTLSSTYRSTYSMCPRACLLPA